ncbi:MAG: hypothetical protein H8E34_03670 [Bacteroidetes bacterium]|nr:hypothetical protein [Bacteroidota bacterium]MBL6944629.1 hypothetical protein [Bacteroidales bacterium]
MCNFESIGLGTWLFIIFIIAFYLYVYWRIFEKAGKPGWAALIPIYNTLMLLDIVGKPWWWILLFLIPVVNIVFAVWMTNLLSLSFGKGVGTTLGLLFLSFIFYPILAFSNAEYKGPAGIQTEGS